MVEIGVPTARECRVLVRHSPRPSGRSRGRAYAAPPTLEKRITNLGAKSRPPPLALHNRGESALTSPVTLVIKVLSYQESETMTSPSEIYDFKIETPAGAGSIPMAGWNSFRESITSSSSSPSTEWAELIDEALAFASNRP